MISAIFEKILMIFIGIGYVLIYMGYGTAGINARKELGKDKWDAFTSMLVTVAVIFWVVHLVGWLRDTAPEPMDTVLVFGMPAFYILWCVFARRAGRRYGRQANPERKPETSAKGVVQQTATVSTAASGNQSYNNNTFDKWDMGSKTVDSSRSGNSGTATSDMTGAWIPGGTGAVTSGIEEDTTEGEPLNRDMGLGVHHVSGSGIHIGMTVNYEAATHTVIYTHWSTQDPEKREVFQIPTHIRTKEALLRYLERETSIPSVWRY